MAMQSKKVAIITGASKGIGKAISLGLAGLNYQTILIARNKAELAKVKSEISDMKGFVPEIIQLDITTTESVRSTIRKIRDKYESIDVLVNNAGVYFGGSVDMDEGEFRKMLETNTVAQFNILQEVVPVMKKQRSGYIFNVASRAGKIGFAGSGGYSASKFALVGLNESLYRELNPLGIRVTALCPGWVDTCMAYEAGTTLEGSQMIQPEDLFKTIQWLLGLSPGACVKEVVIETPYNIS